MQWTSTLCHHGGMTWMATRWIVCGLLCSLMACDKAHVATPASAPQALEAKPLSPAASELPQGVDPAVSTPAKAPQAQSAGVVAAAAVIAPAAAAKAAPADKGASKPAAAASASKAPAAASTATKAPSSPAVPPKATLPQTTHVRFEIDPGMQKLLDADSRMVDWVKRILPVIDTCYREQAFHGSGVIRVAVTVHANKGPDTAIQSLPAVLASLLPCATTRLMTVRPPLFTGPEGEKHNVGIRFKP